SRPVLSDRRWVTSYNRARFRLVHPAPFRRIAMTDTHAPDAAAQPTTLPALCLTALRERPRADVLSHKAGGAWQHISAAEMGRRVRAIALGLFDLGIRKGDRVALLSENRPEWSLTDLAILSLGAVNVPIYTT